MTAQSSQRPTGTRPDGGGVISLLCFLADRQVSTGTGPSGVLILKAAMPLGGECRGWNLNAPRQQSCAQFEITRTELMPNGGAS